MHPSYRLYCTQLVSCMYSHQAHAWTSSTPQAFERQRYRIQTALQILRYFLYTVTCSSDSLKAGLKTPARSA